MKVLIALLLSSPAFAANQVINGFHYASCTPKNECVEVRAPKAYLSFVEGGFSTAGESELVLTSPGHPAKILKGESASLNPRLQIITLEGPGNAFTIYSLTDSRISAFSADRTEGSVAK